MTSKTFLLKELAEFVGGELVGDGDRRIAGVADLEAATVHDITFLMKGGHEALLKQTKAEAVVVPTGVETDRPAIRVKNPVLAITRIHRRFLEQEFVAGGVHPAAHIGSECHVPAQVFISALVVLGNRVVVGERVRMEPGVVVGDDVVIGDDVTLMAGAVIRAGCRIGNRVVVQSNAVIGSDGYGYVQDEQGRHVKRPHVGVVILEDDVEIGANSCVDRATFGATIIRQGAKIDNLVQVAHNVSVGEGSLLAAQSGLAGSTTLGRGVVLGGQAAVTDHVTLGDGVMVGGKAGVAGSVQQGVLSGYPAIDHRTWLRASSAFSKLPQLVKDVRYLGKQLAELQKEKKGTS